METKEFEPCTSCRNAGLERPHHEGHAIVMRNGHASYYRDGKLLMTRFGGYVEAISVKQKP